MPTFTASTPRSISASVASAVATLPATMSTSGNSRRMRRDHVEHALRVAVRRVDDEHVHVRGDQRLGALHRVAARRRSPRRTRSRPSESLQAFGYLTAFWMSLTVIRPFSRKSLIDDQQLLDLVLVQDLARVLERRADRHGDEVLVRHHLADRPLHVGLEPQVAVGEDADAAGLPCCRPR